jgi:hypothetical protein
MTNDDAAVVAVFDTHALASAAIKELAASKFDITKITVVGRGFHTEEAVAGFYSAGDRVKYWGTNGAFWGGIWGLLMGGLFMTVPLIGPVVVAGHLAVMVIAAVEGAVVVGGLTALGAAFYSIGIPRDSVLRYEEAIKADHFIVMAHGAPGDVDRARAILHAGHPTQLDVHQGLNMEPAEAERHRELIAAN